MTRRAGETLISDQLADLLTERLAAADAELRDRYPGDPGTRQPVHTVYVPADRFSAAVPAGWGAAALELLEKHARTPEDLSAATGMPPELVANVLPRVRAKLGREPVEDLRVDFEDGYGHRPDDEEDRAARQVAEQLAHGAEAPTAPPFVGIRFKSLEAATRRRGLRTLELVVAGLLDGGGLPDGFVLTLPKVTSVAQVEAMAEVCSRLEAAYGLPSGRLRFEIQVETPQAVLAPDGTATVARMIPAAAGRCVGLHYGTFDYSAALGIAAAHQSLDHPSADHAKAVLQVAAAGTGVRLSDGSTNVLPVGDRDAVHAAWRLHARLVRRSLERGFYQGWDMHPGHLPTRYLATYAFFRGNLPEAASRIRAYLRHAAGGVMDEPATARALATAVVRGAHCGAVGWAEAEELTGLRRGRLEELARTGEASRLDAARPVSE
jgi:citrate lyase beta subunit